ncbi:hypothetical protein, conserved [Eimeria tenella]|uniref:Uncharacterized protein n=1 Tax=Eimeria tenella TaxID=5802 RepID=U6KU00_EIMTE|nr:hypothetical protein, conserved [Eimeria tenella]CDJ38955.1 hypothetical protein, conserved [Eimeria tenella]|eukprot:XP_013229710.1 hypothetical protein, conserved [Eimeria tenella]
MLLGLLLVKYGSHRRDLILRLCSTKVQQKYPQLKVSWELLDYDAAASVEVTLVNGQTHKQLLEGYSSAQRREIIDKWRFSASLEPWEEVLAPTPPATAAATADLQGDKPK